MTHPLRQEGKRQVVRTFTYYNLDAIISIGFRVNSKRGIQFRQWANKVLKEYLLKGYSVNQRLEQIDTRIQKHEKRLDYLTDKVEFFVRTSLPPVEGIFYDGQLFDAYKFTSSPLFRLPFANNRKRQAAFFFRSVST